MSDQPGGIPPQQPQPGQPVAPPPAWAPQPGQPVAPPPAPQGYAPQPGQPVGPPPGWTGQPVAPVPAKSSGGGGAIKFIAIGCFILIIIMFALVFISVLALVIFSTTVTNALSQMGQDLFIR